MLCSHGGGLTATIVEAFSKNHISGPAWNFRKTFQNCRLSPPKEADPGRPHGHAAAQRNAEELTLVYLIKAWVQKTRRSVFLLNPRPNGPLGDLYRKWNRSYESALRDSECEGWGSVVPALTYQTIPFWLSDVSLTQEPFPVTTAKNLLALGNFRPGTRRLVVLYDQDYHMNFPQFMADNPTCSFLLFTKGRATLDGGETIIDGVAYCRNGARKYEHEYWCHDDADDMDFVLVGSRNKVLFRRDLKKLPSGRLMVLYTPAQTLGFIASRATDAKASLRRHHMNSFFDGDVRFYYQIYNDSDQWMIFITREGSTAHMTLPLLLANKMISIARTQDMADYKLRRLLKEHSDGVEYLFVDPLLAMCRAGLVPSFDGAVNVGAGTFNPGPGPRLDGEFSRSPPDEDPEDKELANPLTVASPALLGPEAAKPAAFNTEAVVREAVEARVLQGQEERAVEEYLEETKHQEPDVESAALYLKIVDYVGEMLKPNQKLNPVGLNAVGARLRTRAQKLKFDEYCNSGFCHSVPDHVKEAARDLYSKLMKAHLKDYPALYREALRLSRTGEGREQVMENSSKGFLKCEPSHNAARLIVDFCRQLESAGVIVALEDYLKTTEWFGNIYAFKKPAEQAAAMELVQLFGTGAVRSWDLSKMNSRWNKLDWDGVKRFLRYFFDEDVVSSYVDQVTNGYVHLSLKRAPGVRPFRVMVPYFLAHQDGSRDTSTFNTIVTTLLLLLVYTRHEMGKGLSDDAAIAKVVHRFRHSAQVGGDDSCIGACQADDTHPTLEEAQASARVLNFKITEERADEERTFVIMLGRWWVHGTSSIDITRQLTKLLMKKPSKAWGNHIRDVVLGILATDPGFPGLKDLAKSIVGQQEGELRWIQRCFSDILPDELVYEPLCEYDMQRLLDVQQVFYHTRQLEAWQKFVGKLTNKAIPNPKRWPSQPLFTLPPLVYKRGGILHVSDIDIVVERGETLTDALSALRNDPTVTQSKRFRSKSQSARDSCLALKAGGIDGFAPQ